MRPGGAPGTPDLTEGRYRNAKRLLGWPIRFRLSPLRNRFLLDGTLGVLGVHLAAVHTPFLQDLLGVASLLLRTWLLLALAASSCVAVMETHKWLARRRRSDPTVGASC